LEDRPLSSRRKRISIDDEDNDMSRGWRVDVREVSAAGCVARTNRRGGFGVEEVCEGNRPGLPVDRDSEVRWLQICDGNSTVVSDRRFDRQQLDAAFELRLLGGDGEAEHGPERQ